MYMLDNSIMGLSLKFGWCAMRGRHPGWSKNVHTTKKKTSIQKVYQRIKHITFLSKFCSHYSIKIIIYEPLLTVPEDFLVSFRKIATQSAFIFNVFVLMEYISSHLKKLNENWMYFNFLPVSEDCP